MKTKTKTLIIFSGGQDSTTCLGYALKNYDIVEAITFNYGQKHSIELKQAKKICIKHNVILHEINIDFLNQIVDSALTSNGDVNVSHARIKNLPSSFVPNRNAIFITLAHALAQKIGANSIMTGVSQADFSGYPDCRHVFVESIQNTLHLASEVRIPIEVPLMYLKKAEIFALAKKYNILDDVINLSHTCYNGDRIHFYEWGYGCNDCPACKLRKKGYYEFIKMS